MPLFLAATGLEELPLIRTIAAAFFAAWVLGLITQKLGLSPIVGYLLAGVLIGPKTPGFTGDAELAHELSEIGVILLMFGVGLHFHFKDLNAVKWIAVPGAVFQSLIATLLGMLVFHLCGWGWKPGAVIGMAMAVASTVVLIRVLTDNDVLHTPAGHVAVGWLIVEDIFTVVFLVILPVLDSSDPAPGSGGPAPGFMAALGMALLKLALFVGLVATIGKRIVPWILVQVARLRSRELFTLTILVLSIAVAAGAYALFGASMALGAFLAGMMVAQSPVSHQAGADALPLRDAFAVIFFVSVGMVFDWTIIFDHPGLLLAGVGIVLVAKPLAALLLVLVLRHSTKTALTVAFGLAQIGEFSFILSKVALDHKLMPEDGHDIIVGVAILSITLNPLLFRLVAPLEAWLSRHPLLSARLNSGVDKRMRQLNATPHQSTGESDPNSRTAIVVGYGHVGRTVDRLLRQAGLSTVIIDMNMDTISELHRAGQAAIFGDAQSEEVLRESGVARARYLLLTMAANVNPAPVVIRARELNPSMHILVRTRFLQERDALRHAGATAAIFEEAEVAIALGELVMQDVGVDRPIIDREIARLRETEAQLRLV